MKATYHDFVTTEQEAKLDSVGKRYGPYVTYNKGDFLSVSKVAKKFNISVEAAKNLMKKLRFNRTFFALNGHRAFVIVRLTGDMYLHPMAIETFKKHLESVTKQR